MISALWSLAKAVPWWAYPFAACVAWGGMGHAQAWRLRGQVQTMRAEAVAVEAKAAAAVVAAKAAIIDKTSKIVSQHAQIQTDADAQNLASADALRGALAAADRLRNAARASRCPVATAAASGPTAAPPDVLPADMLGQCGAALAEMGGFADQARSAGLAAQRAYDAAR